MEATVPILLLAAAFYLLVARPMMTRSRRAQEIKAHLKPGVEIITTAGVIGKVLRVDEDEVQLEIAPGVAIRLLSGAVGKILDPADPTKSDAKAKDEGGEGTGPASPTSD
ncbi:MAG TPA: preprotein translocase subunit YajC [Sporichthya sp.]|nr:preprotein translocase subunit YajC [Sporichthya sp.]